MDKDDKNRNTKLPENYVSNSIAEQVAKSINIPPTDDPLTPQEEGLFEPENADAGDIVDAMAASAAEKHPEFGVLFYGFGAISMGCLALFCFFISFQIGFFSFLGLLFGYFAYLLAKDTKSSVRKL